MHKFLKKSQSMKKNDKIILNGTPLPWVDDVNHLGNLLQFDNSFKLDCLNKRGKFILKVHTLMQEFHYVSSEVMTELLKIYTTSFYSSSLWNLYSAEIVCTPEHNHQTYL